MLRQAPERIEQLALLDTNPRAAAPDLVPALTLRIGKLQTTEKPILDPARSEGIDFPAFEAARS